MKASARLRPRGFWRGLASGAALAAADHSQAVSALAEVRLALRAAHQEARRAKADVSDHEWQLLCESEQAVETLGKTLLEGAACNSEVDHPQRAA